MSNFDNFDIDQISSKFAQIKFFVSYFHNKKNFILGSLNNAENCQKTTFFGTPNTMNGKSFTCIKQIHQPFFYFPATGTPPTQLDLLHTTFMLSS